MEPIHEQMQKTIDKEISPIRASANDLSGAYSQERRQLHRPGESTFLGDDLY